MDTSRELIDFEIANRAVGHLGRHLYRTTPPALAELVANSFDAYARKVTVRHLPTGGPNGGECVIVADDGTGMGLNTLREKYAKIGREKDPSPAPDGMENRPSMGRKGIGKLASFSIGNEYSSYSRAKGDPGWRTFTLKYEDMLADTTRLSVPCETVAELPGYLEDFSNQESGFIVVISSFRKKWIRSTDDSFRANLSRRFCLAKNKYDFSVEHDGEEIDLSRHVYYDALELVVAFGYGTDDLERAIGPAGTRRKDMILSDGDFKNAEIASSFQDRVAGGLRGWIGFVEKPRQLHSSAGENFANVAVYVDGKIADDDLFRDNPEATNASRYMVGEIFADYLSSGDHKDDFITSSREGLDRSDELVDELVRLAVAMRGQAISRWNEFRTSSSISYLPEFISNDPRYRRWLERLDETGRRMNAKLLKVIPAIIDDNPGDESGDAVRTYVNGAIELVETARRQGLQREFEQLIGGVDNELAVAKLAEMLAQLNITEALGDYKIVSEKLRALDDLEKLMNTDAVEKRFQELIGQNPWLIDPRWKEVPEEREDPTFSARREVFNALHTEAGGHEVIRRTFIDLLVTVQDEGRQQSVIVELKRNKVTSYSDVDYASIYGQISLYRSALIKNDDSMTAADPTSIPAVFILPASSGAAETGRRVRISKPEQDELRNRWNINLIPYNRLMSDSRRALSESISLRKSLRDSRPFFEQGEPNDGTRNEHKNA